MTWSIHRDPFNGWREVQGDMGRLFNVGLARAVRPAQPASPVHSVEAASGSWTPLVDIQEGEQSIILEADLPGLKPGDFKLAVENNVLTLSGERQREKSEKPGKAERYQRVERQYGRFTRTFTLPTTVDIEKATAEFRHGVLRVTLPRREELRARQIRIEVKSEVVPAAGEAVNAADAQ